MNTRTCKICGAEKPLNIDFFQRNTKYRKDGTPYFCFIKTCRICQNKRQLPKDQERRKRNSKKLAAAQKIYHQSNKENDSITKKKWYKKNKFAVISRVKRNLYERRKTDILFVLKEKISSRVWAAVRGRKGGKSIQKFLPYTMAELKNHLEAQFKPWMTWKNYGAYRADIWDDGNPETWTWQIDHIIPHSRFNYSSMEDQEFKDCWALSNLRPYSSKQNIIDGDRLKGF